MCKCDFELWVILPENESSTYVAYFMAYIFRVNRKTNMLTAERPADKQLLEGGQWSTILPPPFRNGKKLMGRNWKVVEIAQTFDLRPF